MITNRMQLERSASHELALDCLEAGIEAAHPRTFVERTITMNEDVLEVDGSRYELSAYDDVLVVGGGNAASQVAAELEEMLGERLDGGVVVTDDPARTERVDVLAGTHPTPSEEGAGSTAKVLETAEAADANTLVLGIVTGGGSSLLTAPVGELSVADLRKTTEALLASGAAIHEMNAVRKHLSNVKGGQLARAATPATVAGLVVSDVVGNDVDVVASGPFVPDPTTYGDALAVLDEYDVQVPASVRAHLERGVAGDMAETPTDGDEAFDAVDVHLLADGRTALEAADRVARENGYETMLLSSRVRGEAREAAKTHVAVAEEISTTGRPLSPPAVVLSGGETTVTLRGDGKGGPNLEFGLSAAIESSVDAVVASVDSDGIDGSSDAAGALVDETTVGDERTAARAALANNDALPFLREREAVVETGPTGTNVNDLRVCVIPRPSRPSG